MAELVLKDVAKTYGKSVPVLRDINLEIEEGELVVFVGPSGCGKSTLLRMIAGLEKITGGELTIEGQRMNEVPPAQIRLATGALEGANVNAVHEMSSLVAATRAYDQVANTILREDDKNELRKLAGEDL